MIKDNSLSTLPSGYSLQNFPFVESAVYILIYKKDDVRIPFYVGETDNFHARMRDYMIPTFAASTDFKVGEALKYLETKGMRIEVAVRKDITGRDKRKKEESHMCDALRRQGYILLNDLKGYNYTKANQVDERHKIWLFCDRIMEVV